jgi:hypothetical protein
MAVAYERNVVVEIQEGSARLVVEILHPASNDFQRLPVGEAQILSQLRAPDLECFLRRGLFNR